MVFVMNYNSFREKKYNITNLLYLHSAKFLYEDI
jgi:hypothetical protein